jgi:hypothetical protein
MGDSRIEMAACGGREGSAAPEPRTRTWRSVDLSAARSWEGGAEVSYRAGRPLANRVSVSGGRSWEGKRTVGQAEPREGRAEGGRGIESLTLAGDRHTLVLQLDIIPLNAWGQLEF